MLCQGMRTIYIYNTFLHTNISHHPSFAIIKKQSMLQLFPSQETHIIIEWLKPIFVYSLQGKMMRKAIIHKKLNGTTQVIMLQLFPYLMHCVKSWGNHNTLSGAQFSSFFLKFPSSQIQSSLLHCLLAYILDFPFPTLSLCHKYLSGKRSSQLKHFTTCK